MSASSPAPSPGLTTWTFTRRIIAARRRMFAIHCTLMVFYLAARVVPGLIEKELFDRITGAGAADLGLWPLVALYASFSLAQLKITQEVITLLVFVPFAVFYMGTPLKLDYLWAGLCLAGAVYFIFR